MDALPQALAPLTAFKQFVVYRLSPSETRPGKTDKCVVNPNTLLKIDHTNETAWCDYVDAISYAKKLGPSYGVGFSLTEKDPFFFLDIDDCLDATGVWSQDAIEMCSRLAGAAIEISSSGKGLHIIGSGVCPPHACNPIVHDMEFYTAKRFVALTGTSIIGDASFDCSAQLPGIIQAYFPPKTFSRVEWTTAPCEGWGGPEDDEDLINRALSSRSVRSALNDSSATFRDLWENNIDVLSKAYPSTSTLKPYNASGADMALAQHLAFWTGNNCDRIERLMRASALTREKWQRQDYLPDTIMLACARQTTWVNTRGRETAGSKELNTQSAKLERAPFLSISHQLQLFKDCVYIEDQHKILTAEEVLITPEQFRAKFSGGTFLLDTKNIRRTRNPWEAFISHDDYTFPRVNTTCFDPLSSPRAIVNIGKLTAINTWAPELTPREPGDVTPFINHIKALYPDDRDQMLLVSFLAALVQYKGVKFQYAMLLQGVSGNGKTFIIECITHAIGIKYSYSPRPQLLMEKFNEWQENKILITVEDIKVPRSEMQNFVEDLKAMITLRTPEIRYPGGMKKQRKVCCNYIFALNDKDAIQKANSDRRLMPLFSEQQHKGHLVRDGLTKEYFTNLYNWGNHKGFAYVHEYLATFKIPPEFNPAYGMPAPITSSTQEAIAHGFGGIAQEILEKIEQEASGFKGGWVSSFFLDALLKQSGVSHVFPPIKRRELMRDLGYDWHPALKDGRVNTLVTPDNGKPKLFIKNEHPFLALGSAAEVASEYSKAQV